MTDTQIEPRFHVQQAPCGRYRVVDSRNGRALRYSYGEPLYDDKRPANLWNNYYSALGFCQKMDRATQ